MSPLEFISYLRERLRREGIGFAVTSGQACVHYGIQQTTKDSDWIIPLDAVGKLLAKLCEWDASEPWRVAYRRICGAPLDSAYLGRGWTTHLMIADPGKAHHIDIFGKAPRVRRLETDNDDPDFVSRHVLAQMKKTDRDKDWPIVFSCGQQMLERGDWRGVLHLQDADWLVRWWPSVPVQRRPVLIRERPLLGMIDHQPQRLRRAIAIERTVWVSVNKSRHTCYQRAWKQWYRSWRREPGMQWPLDAPLREQHQALLDACQTHELLLSPLDEDGRHEAIAGALSDAKDIMAATTDELDQIVPPPEILLP